MEYQPQCILITGVAGFICSHLCRDIVSKYPTIPIVGVDKMSYCSSIKNLEDILSKEEGKNNFIFEKVDITDMEKMSGLFQKYGFDTVIHLAAQSHVDNSFGNSLAFTHDNIFGTHILLELSKAYQVKRFLHMSTDECYGTNEEINNENSVLEPTNPYASTKVGAEYLVKSYHRSFNLNTVICRCNNIYGPAQYPEKLIPKFVLRLKKGLKCCIHGDGKQKRSWLFVDDVVSALHLILCRGKIGEVYNVGTDQELDINTITTMLIQNIYGIDDDVTIEDKKEYVIDRCFNDKRYWINYDKIRSTLGWEPKVSIEEGLKKTIQWYTSIDPKDYWSEGVVDSISNAHPQFVDSVKK